MYKFNCFIHKLAYLQAQFSQIQAPGGVATLPGRIAGYQSAPRLAPQQLYFGQGTPGLIPPQPNGYGFQQQLMPTMRSGVAPNFIMPYHLQRQGHPGPRMVARRVGNFQPVQQNQVLFLKSKLYCFENSITS